MIATRNAMNTAHLAYINAVGSTVISAMTFISALWLVIQLVRQGRGKLRVRLLLGMMSSDLLLG